jgi:hypothetical protein
VVGKGENLFVDGKSVSVDLSLGLSVGERRESYVGVLDWEAYCNMEKYHWNLCRASERRKLINAGVCWQLFKPSVRFFQRRKILRSDRSRWRSSRMSKSSSPMDSIVGMTTARSLSHREKRAI